MRRSSVRSRAATAAATASTTTATVTTRSATTTATATTAPPTATTARATATTATATTTATTTTIASAPDLSLLRHHSPAPEPAASNEVAGSHAFHPFALLGPHLRFAARRTLSLATLEDSPSASPALILSKS